MNEIKIFNNPQFGEIRTAKNELGEPLFCLGDLCKALNLSNTTVVANRLDEEEVTKLDLGGRAGLTNFVTESGMYSVVLRSDSPLAKPMQKWVTSEVLPAIRKTGGYIKTTEEDTPEIIMARAILVAQDSINRLKSQLETKERQIELQRHELISQAPKVDYYNEVLDSTGLTSTTIIAKDLGMSAGALNKKLHAMGIIYRAGETWVPYSKYQSRGFVKSKTFPYTDKDGKPQTAIHFYWTETGREFVMSRIPKLQKAQP